MENIQTEVLTGIAIGVGAGIILAVIGWIREHIDHKRIRSMEIRYIKDALVEHRNSVRVNYPQTAAIIYDPDNTVKGAQFYGKSKQEIEDWFRSSGFRRVYKMLMSDANIKTSFTALERWKIESELRVFFKNIDDITPNRFSEIEASTDKPIDVYTTEKLITFVKNMPKTKKKALKLEQR